jgi:hypothetical protein
VQRECLAFALRTRQVDGIWGGLTERERSASTLVRACALSGPATGTALIGVQPDAHMISQQAADEM